MTNKNTNTRFTESRNKREGYFWNGYDKQNNFKVRMHPIDGGRVSLRTYGKLLKNQKRKDQP